MKINTHQRTILFNRSRARRLKRRFAALLCMASVAAMLAGCAPKAAGQPSALPSEQPSATQPQVEQPTPQPTAQPQPEATDAVTAPPVDENKLDPDTLPAQELLTISREGMEEELKAIKQVSQAGYVIYTLEDFDFSQQGDAATVRPAESSPLMKEITLNIHRMAGLDANAALEAAMALLPDYDFEQLSSGLAVPPGAADVMGAYGEKDGMIVKICIFSLENTVYAATMTYPLEASEGGAVLLESMLSTMIATR